MKQFRRILLLLPLLCGCQERTTSTTLSASHAPTDLTQGPSTIFPGGISQNTSTELRADTDTTPRVLTTGLSASKLVRPRGQRPEGLYTLNMADADIRDVVQNVLGSVLKLNYTIDPAVKGNTTIHTSHPVDRREALDMLDAALGQIGASLVESNGFYRVLPSGKILTAPSLVDEKGLGSGMDVVFLRYASAAELVKTLQPFIEQSGRMQADPSRNAVIVLGDASNRSSLLDLIRTFDSDLLSRQSYALFPVISGNATHIATELDKALQSKEGAPLSGVLRVVPMESVNAILVIARDQHYLEDARQLLQIVNEEGGASERRWHIYNVQAAECAELAYVLQRAFTPNDVTFEGLGVILGEPWGIGLNRQASSLGATGQNQTGLNGSGQTPGLGQNTENGAASAIDAGSAGSENGLSGITASGNATVTASNGSQLSTPAALRNNQGDTANGMELGVRIVPSPRNNELLIHANRAEYQVMEVALRKLDVAPKQVKIDAVIAEVTLNDNLQYGTQFFLQKGSLSGILSQASTTSFAQDFPGFVLSRSESNIRFAIEALRSVTKVKILSSPELMVLDNEQAMLQSGERVPYITEAAVSTQQSGAPVVNSINYANTGVILQIRPRINNGDRISLYISQEVNDPMNTTTSTIDSPSFNDRSVRSHVIIEDGQTIGLAGLIRDNASDTNAGLPILKDIPILGTLFGNQNNSRQRTELLVLITPHVVHDQREARLITQELRDKLLGASFVPEQLRKGTINSSANPNEHIGE